MNIHRGVLPQSQAALWDGPLGMLPSGWVLYGDTAIALHLGHRQSIDFDFFSSDRLDRLALRRACPFLVGAKTLQDEPDTRTVVVDDKDDPVKLSFFGGIDFGRVGEPLRSVGHPPIASSIDLLGTKLATVTQRVEARDYVDIAALLQSVKTLTWYRDGGLKATLPDAVKKTLRDAALAFRPETPPAVKLSSRLD